MKNAIYIKEFVGRWYLVWRDTNRTIASFETQFQAYGARRAILNYKNGSSHFPNN